MAQKKRRRIRRLTAAEAQQFRPFHPSELDGGGVGFLRQLEEEQEARLRRSQLKIVPKTEPT
jgi:hypothetical protein